MRAPSAEDVAAAMSGEAPRVQPAPAQPAAGQRPFAQSPGTSANQSAKRELLVTAAADVLATHGVAACTARAIASASPLTKSALHYYFDDTGEIIDLAVQRLTVDYLDRLRTVQAAHRDPHDAFWAVMRAYLRPFERYRRMPLLWFEYFTAAVRRDRPEAVQAVFAELTRFFEALLAAAGAPPARAHG
ncbi:MAG: TetR/AcrR family transcriptional regulator, partial [Acidimicrobiales bacterium]